MKNTGRGGAGKGERPAGSRDRRREVQKHRPGMSNGRIALIVAVGCLVLIVLFIMPRGWNKSIEPLPESIALSTTPINGTDPTSGKPVVAGISSVYKGYTIGHCCEVSKKDWEALSVERKDACIRLFVK